MYLLARKPFKMTKSETLCHFYISFLSFLIVYSVCKTKTPGVNRKQENLLSIILFAYTAKCRFCNLQKNKKMGQESGLQVAEVPVEEGLVRLRGLVKNAGVNGCCQEIVCGSDGMYVSCQVEVELIHWYHLAVPASCCTTFYAKCWAL